MRYFLKSLVMISLFIFSNATPVSAEMKQDFQVILLGTGTPPPLMSRFGPGTLVIAGGQYLLFDAGRGVTQRLWQNKIRLGQINHLFLTHLHSDHVIGIPDLWLTGWLTSPFGRRKGSFKVSGPVGTKNMMSHLAKAYDWDIQTRINDQKLPLAEVQLEAEDIIAGVVYDAGGVTVSAIEVNHGDKIKPAYGYRIDYDGRSVVISGDTKFHPPLAQAAKGTDLFIHAVAAIKPELLKSATHWGRIMDHHTEPEDVGRIFEVAKPKLGVFTHYVLLTNGKIKPPTYADVIKRARTTYQGPLVAGKDGMRFIVTNSEVQVADRPQ